MLRAIGFWHQHVDRLAADLGRLVTKESFRRSIERLYTTALINDDDRIDRRVKQRFEFALVAIKDGVGRYRRLLQR